MNYEIDRNWWLKWYWPHIQPIYRTEGHYGTRQSGKTHNIGRKLIYHSFQPKKFNVVHARKNYNQIEGSTFKILKDIAFKHFHHDFTIIKDHFQLINKNTGNWFRGLGMDHPENAKSVEGANIAWMNECSQFTVEDYDYLDTTIRGATECDISMIMDWNPENINHWLYKEVHQADKLPNSIFIKSTFWDNYLIDRESLHSKLLKIKERGAEGERKYKVWALGEWGVEDPDKLFARDYNRDVHFGKTFQELYDPDKEIYLCWDFNIQNTCLAIQSYGERINVLKEYHIKGYDLKMLSDLIRKEFPDHAYIVNGDASGRAGSALTTGNVSAYQMLKGYLGLGTYNFHVPKSNPSHLNSRLLTNLILKFSEVNISEECVQLDADLMSCEVDERGSLDSYKKKNPERSHHLDPLRYHFHYEHYDKIKLIGLQEDIEAV